MFGLSWLSGTAAEVLCGVLLAAVLGLTGKVAADHFTIANLTVQVAQAGEAKETAIAGKAKADGTIKDLTSQLAAANDKLDAFHNKCETEAADAATGALRQQQTTLARFAAIKPGTGPAAMNQWTNAVLQIQASSLP